MFAQGTTAQIVGTLSDPTGAPVPGALVRATNVDTGSAREARSSDAGAYVLPLLQPGRYRIAITKDGFRPVSRIGINLMVDQVARADQQLELGSLNQEIQVSAAAPLLETETSAIGQVVDSAKIQSIPLNGRSSFRLVQLTPGLLASPAANGQFGDIPVNTNQDSTFSINGGRQLSNEILIDGVPSTTGQFNSITTIPSIEATREFKVQSSNLSAEWGRFGGGVVNVSTRSGTNQVHGALYEYLRNNVFDANEFFNKTAGLSIPPFRLNQFGGAVGGPVKIGKLYDGGNRTFFFTDYQGTRYRRGDTTRFSLPTAAQRDGDFSRTFNQAGALVTVYDPSSTQPDPARAGQSIRTPFAGNRLPASRIDPIARKLMAYYPEPNSAGEPFTGLNNYGKNASRGVDQNQISGRVDHTFNSAYRMFGRFAHNRTLLGQPDSYGNVATSGNGSVGVSPFRQTTFALDHAVSLSPTSIFSLKYGVARWYQERKTRSYGFDQRTLGYSDALVSQFQIPVFPAIGLDQYDGLGGQSFFTSGNDTHSFIGAWTKIRGKQTLKIGGEMRLRRTNFILSQGGGGSFNFDRAFTRGPNPLQFYDNAGNSIASLLLGTAASGSVPIVSGVSAQNFYTGGYLQSDFRVTPRLVINAGLRYETESPFTERYNSLNYFDRDLPSPVKNSQFPALTGGLVFANPDQRHVWQWDRINFAPRLGFAWSALRKTVVRGGGGFFFAPAETSNVATAFASNAGYAASTPYVASIDGGLTPFRTLSNPYPDGLLRPVRNTLGASTFLGQGLAVWDNRQVMPVTYQWNLDLQRELPGQILVDVAYVGSRGVHLAFKNRQLNELDPQFLTLGPALNQQVPNPFFGSINVGTLAQRTVTRRQLLLPFPQFTNVNIINMTMANSIYHSLQIKVDKRFSKGMSVLVAYTLSKLITDSNNTVSNNGGPAANNTTNTQNWYNLRSERSLSETDVPRNLVVSFVAELPFGPGKKFLSASRGVGAKLAGGWQLNGITSYRAGFPLSISAIIAGGGNRPNSTGQSASLSSPNLKKWFDTGAFLQPASFSLGNVGRTLPDTRGPAIFNLDLSLLKNIRLTERAQLQLRFEYFNVTNTPPFGLPNTALGSGAFGRVQFTLLLPRVGQVAAKIIF